MKKVLWLALLLPILAVAQEATTQRMYVRADCDTLTAGQRDQLCFDTGLSRTEVWNGTAWVAYSGTTGSVSLVGNTVNIEASFTRPADTTAYAAGDIVSNSTSAPVVITFSNVAAAGLGGTITDVVMSMSTAAATKLEGELWLFHTSPAAINDNAAFAISDAEADDVVCVVPLGSAYSYASSNNVVYHSRNLGCAFEAAGAGTDIYGLLVARNAYTPANAEVFNIRLHVLKD